MKYQFRDIGLTAEGDLLLGPNDDFYSLRGIDAMKQQIEFRLKTDLGDMFLHKRLGTDLRDMVGKRNTKQLVEHGKASIMNCLCYGGFLAAGDIYIVSLPLDAQSIIYHIEINLESGVPYKFDLLCDPEDGIRMV